MERERNMNEKSTIIYFTRKRTNKKDWVDAACSNCYDSLWFPNKTTYVWISTKSSIDVWLQLCEKCSELL